MMADVEGRGRKREQKSNREVKDKKKMRIGYSS